MGAWASLAIPGHLRLLSYFSLGICSDLSCYIAGSTMCDFSLRTGTVPWGLQGLELGGIGGANGQPP